MLAENAALIAPYRVFGVAHREHPISQLTIVIGKLREEIQKVANAIALTEMGLPTNLDTQLTGAG